eukprot:6152449-Prymnesium_polylepis.1
MARAVGQAVARALAARDALAHEEDGDALAAQQLAHRALEGGGDVRVGGVGAEQRRHVARIGLLREPRPVARIRPRAARSRRLLDFMVGDRRRQHVAALVHQPVVLGERRRAEQQQDGGVPHRH